MELALAACLGWVTTTYLLVKHLGEIHRHYSLQISGLLNRIQAPEVTVAQELTQADDYEPLVLPHDEDSYWSDVEKVKA